VRAAVCDGPLGAIRLTEEAGRIAALDWGARLPDGAEGSALLDAAAEELRAYLAGRLRRFSVPLAARSSPFQHLVFEAMMAIPYGETRTYGDIASALDSSARAVGQACGANPIPILIPCHRVLGAGSLGGYSGAGGAATKLWLLELEGAAGRLL
jgi:methylated-DNA-[protein]-cysteine S-methyltransferase